MSDAYASRKTHAAVTKGKGSVLQRYMDVVVGKRGFLHLLYFEFCLWLAPVPGALGIFLRKTFWPRLFQSCGKGTVFATGIKLMHPNRIRIGSGCVFSDNCVLDARSADEDTAIEIGDDCMFSHHCIVAAKGGSIRIGNRGGYGAFCMVYSGPSEPVSIGDDTIFGPYSYLTGGSNYRTERLDIPISQQGKVPMGGVTVGDGSWFATGARVLGGVSVGDGAIVGAGAHVMKDLPDLSISVGMPAKIVKYRDGKKVEV